MGWGRDWAGVVALGSALPEVTETTWNRSPALAVRGKRFCRLRSEAEGGLVLFCGHDEKAALLARGGAFYTTPHYDGYGAILVDLSLVDPEELWELLVESWRATAPVRVRKAFDAGE